MPSLKKNLISGTQDDTSALTSITVGTQYDPSTFTSRTGDSRKPSNVKPDKVHRNNLVASSPLQKYPIHQRVTSEPHGSKPFYTGSDNSFTERPHDEETLKLQLFGWII